METTINLWKKISYIVKIRYYIVTIFFLLTLLNNSSYAQMNWNYACVFPGNAYIAASNTNTINPLFSFNLDIFTLECWVCPNDALNPQRQIIMQKAYGNNNYGYCMYLDSGRLAVKTNNITRVISHGMIPSQKWTHVALTFYSERIFSLYINGILDRRDTIINAFPVANPDSLYIGTGSENNFHGIMDEIRIWHRALPDTEVYRNFRTTLGTEAGYNQNGYYTGLVMSFPFQTNNGCFNFINPPIIYDWSGCGNVGWLRSVYLTDLSNRPYNTIDNNEAFDNLQGGYAVSANDPLNSPGNAITIEVWVYAPDALYRTFVEKGSTSNVDFWLGTGATGVDNIDARINNTILSIGYPMPSGIWEHLAFTYNGTNGEYKFYFNGDLISTSVNNVGPVSNHAIDSFYIGWGPHVPEAQLLGFLDEVRISNYIKTGSEIYQDMFRSINCTNVPHPLNNNLCYAFDGYAVDNISSANLPCYFRSRAKFSNPSTEIKVPEAPVERSDQLGFYNNSWFVHHDFYPKRIPQSGFGGYMGTDSMLIAGTNQTINDLNLFIGLDHENSQELQITLISPDGDSARVFSNEAQLGTDNNIVTIFDDQADSSLVSNRYTSFGPRIKGEVSLNNKFQGHNPIGYWKLSIYDNGFAANTGWLYGWAIQINNGNLTGINNNNNQIADKYSLSQNYPNPFNPTTKISYSIPKAGNVELKVYDVLGREVALAVNEFKNAGLYTLNFDGSKLSSGVYFYKLSAGDFEEVKKMVLIK